MKKYLHILIILQLVCSAGRLWASSQFYSGGNAHTLALGSNGQVYSWGNNVGLQLGRDVEANNGRWTSIPGKVDLPVTAVAVDAGFGWHSLALACDSTVWAWGAADLGQLGNGINSVLYDNSMNEPPAIQQTPTAVRAGETNIQDPFAVLQGVTDISGGDYFSLALLNTGHVVSWGSNELNSLGSGGSAFEILGEKEAVLSNAPTESSLPVYVRSENGDILENVIAISAGYFHAYALVDDDDDGDPNTGRVYAWGSTWGETAPVIASERSSTSSEVATLVVDMDGHPLSGIYKICAGGSFGFFIQKGTGYVYSVGSNDGGIRGGVSEEAQPYATLVLSGEIEEYTGFQDISNVVDMVAGQAHVLISVELNGEAYAMTWGSANPYYIGVGNDDQNSNGAGYLGRGKAENTNTAMPRFVYDATGQEKLKNVHRIAAGDGVSFVQTVDPVTGESTFYGFGCNNFGQLGLGDATAEAEDSIARYLPTEFMLSESAFAQPCPVANFGAESIMVCPDCPEKTILFSGTVDVPVNTYSWTIIGTDGIKTDITAQAAVDGNRATMPANQIGQFVVTIKDDETLAGQLCRSCPLSSDTITVTLAKPTFDTVYTTFCGDNPVFKTKIIDVSEYEFFDAATGGNSLGTGTLTSGMVQLAIDKSDAFSATPLRDSLYAVWIEATNTDGERTMLLAENICPERDMVKISAAVVKPSTDVSLDGPIELTITGGTEPYAIAWSNGSTGAVLTGISTGKYQVTVTDALDQNSSETIQLDPESSGGYSIEGRIVNQWGGGIPATVFVLSNASGYYVPYKWVTSDIDGFYIGNLPEADYILFAIPPKGAGYVPTFAYGASIIENAYQLHLDGIVDHFNIAMLETEKRPKGNAVLSGSVYSNCSDVLENKSFAISLKSPAVANVPVVLYQGDQAVAWDITAEVGSYSFTDLPEGTYSIYIAGHPVSDAQNVTVDGTSAISLDLDFDPVAVSTFAHELGISEGIIQPNPATDMVSVFVEGVQTVTIYDMLGNEMPVQLFGNELDVRFLPKGVYTVYIQNQKTSIWESFVKQ